MEQPSLEQTLRALTPEHLGRFAAAKLFCGSAYALFDNINEVFVQLNTSELIEMVRYANHLAEKEGLGKDYFLVGDYSRLNDLRYSMDLHSFAAAAA